MNLVNKNCAGCGVCVDICPVTALKLSKSGVVLDKDVCVGCGICARKCPAASAPVAPKPGNYLIRDIRFQVTRECNLRCPWCFSDSGKPLVDELSLGQSIHMVDKLTTCGLKTMTLTGGEPLLRKDFSIELLKYLRGKDIYSKLFTNGSLLDDGVIAALSGIVNEIQISVYPKTSRRRIKELFGKLRKHKIRAVMRVTLTSGNYGKIKDLVGLAQEINADALRVRPFISKGRGLKHKDLFTHKAGASIGYLVSIRRQRNYPIQLLTPSFAFLYDKHIDLERLPGGFRGYTLCKCIEDMGTILPDGTVRACGYFPQDLGNITRQDFGDIWSRNNRVKNRLIVETLDKECMGCKYIAICGGGCRANAFVNKGSLTAPDPSCPRLDKKDAVIEN